MKPLLFFAADRWPHVGNVPAGNRTIDLAPHEKFDHATAAAAHLKERPSFITFHGKYEQVAPQGSPSFLVEVPVVKAARVRLEKVLESVL